MVDCTQLDVSWSQERSNLDIWPECVDPVVSALVHNAVRLCSKLPEAASLCLRVHACLHLKRCVLRCHVATVSADVPTLASAVQT